MSPLNRGVSRGLEHFRSPPSAPAPRTLLALNAHGSDLRLIHCPQIVFCFTPTFPGRLKVPGDSYFF